MGKYKFAEQLAIGEAWEQRLDQFFLARFPVRILVASMAEQRRGIDRLFVAESGAMDSIEYKSDNLAGDTGNAFIETVSVDTIGKPGWAVTSQAKYLVYLVTGPETIYLVPMCRIRASLPRWKRLYREVSAQNNGYRTLGLLVPLDEMERIAVHVW